jgi:hypothetical protein
MIAESSQVTFFRSINKLMLGKGHEIEVPNSFFVILDGTPPEGWLIDDFADILENEIIGI